MCQGLALLNQHVQLAPHHVDEQFDPTSFHQVAKQPRRDLEPVRVDEEERGRDLSAVAAEFDEDGGRSNASPSLVCTLTRAGNGLS